MGAVYLGFYAYIIEPGRLFLLLLIMLVTLMYLNIRFTYSNVIALNGQLQNLRSSDIHAMVLPVAQKLSMMRKYLVLLYIYFGTKIVIILVSNIGGIFLSPD